MTEIWKKIIGYEKYEISNFGNVKSYCRYRDGKLMKSVLDSYGYRVISLCKNSKGTAFKIHRLVAIAFIPNIDNLPTVDHIDRNRTNNHLSNLRWASNKLQVINSSTYREDILELDPVKRLKILKKNNNIKNIETKRFACELCGVYSQDITDLKKHLKTEKHKLASKNKSKNPEIVP